MFWLRNKKNNILYALLTKGLYSACKEKEMSSLFSAISSHFFTTKENDNHILIISISQQIFFLGFILRVHIQAMMILFRSKTERNVRAIIIMFCLTPAVSTGNGKLTNQHVN